MKRLFPDEFSEGVELHMYVVYSKENNRCRQRLLMAAKSDDGGGGGSIDDLTLAHSL